jgi:hypothetical protein
MTIAGSGMQIFIKTLTGSTITLSVDSTTSIETVKYLIQGTPASDLPPFSFFYRVYQRKMW